MVARWGARWNAAGSAGRGDERWGRQPRWDEVSSLAEIEGGLVKGEAADGSPEVERVAVGAAGEAAVDLPGEMDGEGPL